MATREQRQLWTFSTSGWLFCYHFGVVKALKEQDMSRCEYVPLAVQYSVLDWSLCSRVVLSFSEEFLSNICRKPYVIGSSGGACAGTYLFLDASISRTIEYIQECAKEARSSWRKTFAIKRYALGAIERFSPAQSGQLSLMNS